MTPKETKKILAQLGAIRRRVDALRREWEMDRDNASVIRGLDELSAASTAHPSIQALLFGAARLIEGGEPSGQRLEKLSDHLHGYMVGWEDAAEASSSL